MIVCNYKEFNHKGFSIEKLDYMKTFDFDFNIIVGGRSNYKTSTLQIDSIKQFKENGFLSIRLVRFETDRETEFIENFFSQFAKDWCFKEYGCSVEYKKKSYWLVYYDYETGEKTDEFEFMKVVALSKAQKYKSNGLEKYTMIIFDEFVPEDGIYLAKEFEKLLGLISTVNRNRKTGLKVYLIGNMISIDNYYFKIWNIDAMEIKSNNIYDFSIDGYQRVGLYCIGAINKSFDDAPRILKSRFNNVQETSQNEYQIPKDILTTESIFIYLLLQKDKTKFENRFYISSIIDITDKTEHKGFIIIYSDIYDKSIKYVLSNKEINKNFYVAHTKEYLKSNTTNTIHNSIVEYPVYEKECCKYLYSDTDTRKLFIDIIGD